MPPQQTAHRKNRAAKNKKAPPSENVFSWLEYVGSKSMVDLGREYFFPLDWILHRQELQQQMMGETL